MRRLALLLLLVAAVLSGSYAAEFKQTNGDVLKGEPSSFNDDGLVVRLEVGGFSQRVPWGRFTQETLKQLAEMPEAREYVEPYIEIPVEVKAQEREKRRQITVIEPPRVPLVEDKSSLFASLANPVGFFILGALYLANLYAALEIARWKGRPVALVVGVSALVPFLGPLLFAFLPPAAGAASEPIEQAPAVAEQTSTNPLANQNAPASGLGLAGGAAAKGTANPVYSQVYSRSNTTFDRRFFETKFSGFFRVVPADPEKDLVIAIKTPKQEVRAVRVSRISGTEIHFQAQSGAEVSVPFGEIMEVAVKPKAAK